jgi:hypothetical protein
MMQTEEKNDVGSRHGVQNSNFFPASRKRTHLKQMDKMQKRRWSYQLICAITLSLVTIAGSAFAYDLSDKDIEYLKTLQMERDHAPILDLSPKERSRLHELINDPRTANDTAQRDKNVRDVVAVFFDHQLWEKAHPGELWDAPRSNFPPARPN